MKGNICFSNLAEQNASSGYSEKWEVSHSCGCSTKRCCPCTAFQIPRHPCVGCSIFLWLLWMPHRNMRRCAPWPVGGSVQCVNYMRGDPVHFCHTAEVWTRPLTLGLLSTAPPLEWTTTVCQKITTHLTGTHTLQLTLVCSRCMYICGMHEQMLTSTSGGWWVDMQGGV